MATKKMTLNEQIQYAQQTMIYYQVEANDTKKFMEEDEKRKEAFYKKQPKKMRDTMMAYLKKEKEFTQIRVKQSKDLAEKYQAIYNSLKRLKKITNK